MSQISVPEIKARVRIEDIVGKEVSLKKEGDLLVGLCPFHDDHRPSFKVSPSDQCYKCWSCGAAGDVIDWVKARRNIGFKDALTHLAEIAGLVPPGSQSKPNKSIESTYDYVDESGSLLYQSVRYRHDDGSKSFAIRQPDGSGGWTYSGKGLRWVLMDLPGLAKAIQNGIPIFLHEGEKSAMRMNRDCPGTFSTTAAKGSKAKWEEEFTASLRGADLTIVRDRDEPGRKRADTVYHAVRGDVSSVRVVESASPSTTKNDGHDIVEHLDAGLGVDDLVEVDPPADIEIPLQSEAEDGDPLLTELGNAARLVELFGNELRYVARFKSWYVWDGVRWVEDEQGRVYEYAKKTARSLFKEAEKEHDDTKQKAIVAHAIRSQKSQAIKAIVELAKTTPKIALSPNDFDTDNWLLNCTNGILDLNTGKLSPHRRWEHMSKIAPVTFDPNAKCTRWESWLLEIMGGDADFVSYIQRVIGYCLTGSIREQGYFIFHGSGANGKSTLLNVLRCILGSYAVASDMETFLTHPKGNPQGPRPDIARLAGARFVSAVEVPRGREFDVRLLKAITGGDPITARYLYSKEFEFNAQCKLIFGLNDLPKIHGHDEATWRRVHRVPFKVTIPPEKRDKDLEQKLLTERSGILAWAVRGCLDWQSGGLQPPKGVLEANNEYQRDMDPVGQFIALFCKYDRIGIISSKDLHTRFNQWAEENDMDHLSAKSFGSAMNGRPGVVRKNYTSKKSIHYFGIRLLSPEELAKGENGEDGDRVPENFPCIAYDTGFFIDESSQSSPSSPSPDNDDQDNGPDDDIIEEMII